MLAHAITYGEAVLKPPFVARDKSIESEPIDAWPAGSIPVTLQARSSSSVPAALAGVVRKGGNVCGLDTTGDGRTNILGLDTTGDGMVDTIAFDSKGDGLVDSVSSSNAPHPAAVFLDTTGGGGQVDALAPDHWEATAVSAVLASSSICGASASASEAALASPNRAQLQAAARLADADDIDAIEVSLSLSGAADEEDELKEAAAPAAHAADAAAVSDPAAAVAPSAIWRFDVADGENFARRLAEAVITVAPAERQALLERLCGAPRRRPPPSRRPSLPPTRSRR